MNANIAIERIGKEKATEMLTKVFPGQRNISKEHVRTLVVEMKEGRWRLSQDAIVVVSGELANGQHRLKAVVEAGGEYPFLVLRTNDREIYRVIDDGMKRRPSDVILMRNGFTAAAATSIVVMYDRGQLSIHGRQTASKGLILSYLDKHRDEMESCAARAVSLLRNRRLVPGSVMAAFLHIAGRFDTEQSERFVSEIFDGNGSSTAARVLGDRLMKDRMARMRFGSPYWLALMIKAYRAYYEARELKILKIADGEEYPKFPGE